MRHILQKLAKLADYLDSKGLTNEAELVDEIMKQAIDVDPEEIDRLYTTKDPDTNLTLKDFVDLENRWHMAEDDAPGSVKIERFMDVGGNDKFILRFPTGPNVELTGEAWDKLQVFLGIM